MVCNLRQRAAGIACLGFLWVGAAQAQAAAPTPSQAPRLFRAVRSPTVNADGSATVRHYAPGAKKVLFVRDGGTPVKMALEGNGVWSLTTTPLPPGYYVYCFLVDGVPTADPSNTLAAEVAAGGHESILHLPGPDSLSWAARDIPHGVLHRHEYTSAAVAEPRQYWVYTPPGFAPASRKRYRSSTSSMG